MYTNVINGEKVNFCFCIVSCIYFLQEEEEMESFFQNKVSLPGEVNVIMSNILKKASLIL